MIIGNTSVILLYQYFYQKKYSSPKYCFKPTLQAISKINQFLEFLDKKYDLHTLGPVFLTTYFMFQFNRTHNQVFQRFASKSGVAGKIQIYDIIGKKAFDYWVNREIGFDYVLQNCEFASVHNVRYSEILKFLVVKEVESALNIKRSEEIEKKRFYNTNKGFLNCIHNTTLFNHRSVNCITCDSKRECKELLQANYPLIFNHRGYE